MTTGELDSPVAGRGGHGAKPGYQPVHGGGLADATPVSCVSAVSCVCFNSETVPMHARESESQGSPAAGALRARLKCQRAIHAQGGCHGSVPAALVLALHVLLHSSTGCMCDHVWSGTLSTVHCSAHERKAWRHLPFFAMSCRRCVVQQQRGRLGHGASGDPHDTTSTTARTARAP